MIRVEVSKKWPGNDLPMFGKANIKEREEMVQFVKNFWSMTMLKNIPESDLKRKVVLIVKERRKSMKLGKDYGKVNEITSRKRF